MIKIRYILFYLKKKLFFFNNYPNGVIFPNKNYIEKLYNIKCKTIIENIELNYYFKKLINKKTKKIKITTNKLYFKKKYDFYFANFYLFHNKNFFYEKNKRRFNLKHNYIFNDKFFDFSNTKKLNIDNFSEKFSKIPRKIKLFKKPIINISTMGNNSYFHWLFFPGLINISSLDNSELSDLKNYLFYIGPLKKIPNYIYDTFKILNISKKQIITKPCTSNLIISSYQENYFDSVTQRHISFLRKYFLPHVLIKNNTNSDKIYIARKDKGSRNLDNLIKFEEFIITIKNFKKVYLEELSLFDQISIFRNAKFIIGVHGAGMSNTVFCNNNVKIIEIIPSNRISTLVTSICMINKFDYYPFLLGDTKSKKKFTFINLTYLNKFLRLKFNL